MNRLRRQVGLLALLLSALLLRGVLPTGYMPGKSLEGRVSIVLCSSQGGAGEAVAAAKTGGMDCPFGFALSMGGAPEPLSAADFAVLAHEQPQGMRASGTVSPVLPHYQARGPPTVLV